MGMPTWEEVAKEKQRREKYEQSLNQHSKEIKTTETNIKEFSTLKRDNRDFYGDCDRPGTMENSTATFIWIVSMIISALFKGGWVLCILETIAWWKFITRHNN